MESNFSEEQQKAFDKFTETACAVAQVLRLMCRNTEEECICDMLASSIDAAFLDLGEQFELFGSDMS